MRGSQGSLAPPIFCEVAERDPRGAESAGLSVMRRCRDVFFGAAGNLFLLV